jgi:ATP-dependent protease ClpP protease subunit
MLKRVEIDPYIKVKKEEDLVEPPAIIRVVKFDEDATKAFSESMSKAQSLPQPVIPVVVDSYGGQTMALLTMITEILGSKKPVATVVEGKAMSCGAILAAFGTRGYRYVGPHAWIMIHQISCGTWGKENDVKTDAEMLTAHNKQVFEMLARHCGKKPNFFMQMMRERANADWYIRPREALKCGMADFVRVPELVVRIRMETTFE